MGCCAQDTTLTNVTCGEGLSCTGQCSAIGATLCPSGNCTENPEDCRLSPLLDQEEGHSRKGPSISALPSWAFKWCAPRCKVYYHAVCCFHPTCRWKKWDQCNWMRYHTGRFHSRSFMKEHIQVTLALHRVSFLMVSGAAKSRKSPSLMPLSWTVTQIPTMVRSEKNSQKKITFSFCQLSSVA